MHLARLFRLSAFENNNKKKNNGKFEFVIALIIIQHNIRSLPEIRYMLFDGSLQTI